VHLNKEPESFVGMLNKATIDIEQEPLGDSENGVLGVDDVEDVEGGEEELEEVDEGTFEDAANHKGPCKRMANYCEIEDEGLIRACECVTLDAVTGTDQTGKWYWQY
jgi:hypothetical protein